MTKKPKEQPIGIVIATGQSAPVAPRVRAYYWCESEPPVAGQEEVDK
jgi:hypothetical protein